MIKIVYLQTDPEIRRMQNIYKFRLVLESKLSAISFEALNYGTEFFKNYLFDLSTR